MEKSKKCSEKYNLRVVGHPSEKILLLCLFAENRERMAKIIDEAGAKESSGICDKHYSYAEWFMNQPKEGEGTKQKSVDKLQKRIEGEERRIRMLSGE